MHYKMLLVYVYPTVNGRGSRSRIVFFVQITAGRKNM